jgi:5-methylcytosine-specific restriction endonuclease McrA
MDDLQSLSDEQLLAAIDRYAREERERLPFLLACLGEGDRRGIFVKKGYSSTFDYCVRWLKFSEDEACRRIQAARATVRRPELLSAMTDGLLSLTAVSKLAPHVGRADASEIISRAEGKSKRELEELLAPLCPEPVKHDRVRTIAVEERCESPDEGSLPVATLRVEFSFHGPPALRDAIDRAKEILSNKFPFGAMSDVLLEIVGDYLNRHDPQKALELGKFMPVKSRSSIPTGIRRAVWARDGGRCAFSGPDGTRCLSRRALEIDHRKPRAQGGRDTIENLRLLCRPHNDAERRRLLGEGELFTDPSRNGSVDNSG